MTPFRWMVVLFWVFIGGMLVWQFTSYNSSIAQASVDHPSDQHYFFFPPDPKAQASASAAAANAPKTDGADVRQVGYSLDNDKPSQGFFTAHIVVKNVGTAKATNVQVMVNPFRGGTVGDVDIGDDAHVVSDTDPRAQTGQWITFSDLEPGASDTQTYVFMGQSGISPGANSNPQVIFQSEKPKP